MTAPRYQLVPGGRLVHRPWEGGVGWRLLGSNNRELGRSAAAYPDTGSAMAEVERMRLLAPEAAAHVVHDAVRGTWSWRLDGPDGTTAAISGRGFRYERDCRLNLQQFREAAPGAAVV